MEKIFLLLLCLFWIEAAGAKQGRTYFDESFMAGLQQKLAKERWAQEQATVLRRDCQWLMEMSDQALWDFIPPPEQMRAINVCIGHDCPICGDEINRKAGHYPWLLSHERPFKVECPVCHNVFPKNDFQPWNTEGLKGEPARTPEPLDYGLGWLNPEDGRRYYFVPYYIFWQRWRRDILSGLLALSQAYLVSDEPAYAHKCALMLAKIGSMYERFNYGEQCYHEGHFHINGRISDYIWSTGDDSIIALAYDAIYPALAQDEALAHFLRQQGLKDARDIIERMLFVMARDIMSGFVAGNMGMHQKTLAQIAIVLDNRHPQRGPTTQQMAEWLMHGGGRLEDLLWNGFHREGMGAEAAPGYSIGWGSYFYEVADLLPRLGLDIWRHPKLRKMADIGPNLIVAGQFCPSIGDSGSSTGSGPVGLSPALQGRAFRHYKDPIFARWLEKIGASSHSLFESYFEEAKYNQALSTAPPLPELRTRDLGGYGLAILEAGTGSQRRGLSLYYGDASGGHGHADRLNIEMFALGHVVLPDDGYPTPFIRPHFYEWRRANTFRHYCVMIDELPQLTYWRGYLHALASTAEIQFVEASAEAAYPDIASMYRRTCALIDLSPASSYLLDIWRVRGGSQHDWSFHGPNWPEFHIAGGELSPPQTKGTLAGEDVSYGQRPPPRLDKADLEVSLASAEGVIQGDKPYSELAREGWTPHVKGVLTYKEGSELTARLPRLAPGRYKLYVQYWDHRPGTSELQLTIGGASIPLQIVTAEGQDYKWQSQLIELPQAAETLQLKLLRSPIHYVMINRLLISQALERDKPRLPAEVSSGFQGLFNVQRMRPQAGWRACWSDPQKNLHIALHMPASCAQEIIVCEGEPEAQPGNPKTIKYILGRNISAQPELLSVYSAIVEPYREMPDVQAVQRLSCPHAPPETVGLLVQRQHAAELIHSALPGAPEARWEDAPVPFAAQADFALVTLDELGVQRAMLLNGGHLSCGDFRLHAAPAPQGRVVAVDLERNEITLDIFLPETKPFLGRVIIFGNDLAQCSYTIQSLRVAEGKTIIGLGDMLPIVRMDYVKNIDEAAGVVEAVGPLEGYGKIQNARQQGRWLYNEDKTRGFLIESIEGTKIKLRHAAGKRLKEIYQDANGNGQNQIWIADMGPNDRFLIPTTTFAKRLRPGVYQLETMTQASLVVPIRKKR